MGSWRGEVEIQRSKGRRGSLGFSCGDEIVGEIRKRVGGEGEGVGALCGIWEGIRGVFREGDDREGRGRRWTRRQKLGKRRAGEDEARWARDGKSGGGRSGLEREVEEELEGEWHGSGDGEVAWEEELEERMAARRSEGGDGGGGLRTAASR